MRNIARLGVIAGLYAAVCQTAYAETKPCSITINATQATIKSGEQVVLGEKISNTSDNPIIVHISPGGANGELFASVVISRPDGNAIAKTDYLKKLKEFGWGGSSGGGTLAPGTAIAEEVNISNLYDLSKPGKYKVYVVRRCGPDLPVRKSNSISLTVTP